MLISGNVVAGTGIFLSILYFTFGGGHAVGFFGPLFFVGMGNGLTLPSSNAGIVSVRPHLAGSASGLGGAIQIGGGAGLSVIGGLLLTPQSGPTPLLWLMLTTSICGVMAALYTRSVAQKMKMAMENQK